MSSPRVKLLVIGDDAQSFNLITASLESEDVEIRKTGDSTTAFEVFLEIRPKIVLLDLAMPEVGEMGLLGKMINADPGVDVILIATTFSAESAVEAIQEGACDYFAKPLDLEKLRSRIASLLRDAETRRKTLRLDQELVDACQFEGMVGRSPVMLDVFAKIRRIAPHFRTVLVTGATGTGKELVALALHRLSPAAGGRFVVCNCAALVETLVESELFGYVRGAFTDAVRDRAGLFESSDGGAIFLDEIGELSLAAQAKLLRVLQNHQVQRIGSTIPRDIDVRVIAATHRDLKTMVREGRFREDLYYRLTVIEVTLPPLALRREDIPLLQRYFVRKFAAEYGKPIAGLSRRAQRCLALYSWPGNARELENVLGNACMMAEGNVIDIDDLPERLRTAANPEDESSLLLEAVESRHIRKVLEGVGGDKLRAARLLGVSRSFLYKFESRHLEFLGGGKLSDQGQVDSH